MAYLEECLPPQLPIAPADLDVLLREHSMAGVDACWKWGEAPYCKAGWAAHGIDVDGVIQTFYQYAGEPVQLHHGSFRSFREASDLPGTLGYFVDSEGIIYSASTRGDHTNYPGPLRVSMDPGGPTVETLEEIDGELATTGTFTLWASLRDLAEVIESL